MLKKIIGLFFGLLLLVIPFKYVSANLSDDYKNTQAKIVKNAPFPLLFTVKLRKDD